MKTLYMYNSKNKIIPLSLFFLVLFVMVAFIITTNTDIYNNFDKPISDYFHNIMLSNPTSLPRLITNFGDKYTILGFLATVTAICALLRLYKEEIFVFIATGGDFIITGGLKLLFNRTRPVFENIFLKNYNYGFPSGHTTLAVCFYGAIMYLLIINIKNKTFKIISSFILSLLIFAIGFTRVYLGAHYLSDVIGGYCIGFFWLFLSIWIYNKYWR